MPRVLSRDVEICPVLDWIAAVTAHIPNKGEHLLRDYGWVSRVNRGKRKKAEEHAQHAAPAGAVEIPPPHETLGVPAAVTRPAAQPGPVFLPEPAPGEPCGG